MSLYPAIYTQFVCSRCTRGDHEACFKPLSCICEPCTARREAAEVIRLSVVCRVCPCGVSEHLLLLGPFRFCMEADCTCGRRALMAFFRSLMPLWPVFIALGYLGYHLACWAALGFMVVAQ